MNDLNVSLTLKDNVTMTFVIVMQIYDTIN